MAAFTCTVCNIKFIDEESFKKHIQEEHATPRPDGKQNFQTEQPGVVLGTRPMTDFVGRYVNMCKTLGKKPAVLWLPMEWVITLWNEQVQYMTPKPPMERRFRFNDVEVRAADAMMQTLFVG